MSYIDLKRRYSTGAVVEYVQLMQSNQMNTGYKSVALWTRNGPCRSRSMTKSTARSRR